MFIRSRSRMGQTEPKTWETPERSSTGRRGIVKVYQLQTLTTVVTPGNATALAVLLNNDSLSPRFENLMINQPGDFTPATPTVLDTSDPFAEGHAWQDRLRNGMGVWRAFSEITGWSAFNPCIEPEEWWQTSDFSYGGTGKPLAMGTTAYPTQLRAWDWSVSPYIYSHLFGSPYSANLSVAISDLGTPRNYNNCTLTVSTITISDAATAPVLKSLRLKVDDELMRVLAVNGTQVTVERGACSTAITTHATGTIQVQNRFSVSNVVTLPGTVTVTTGSNQVTGVGTNFTPSADFGIGQLIYFSSDSTKKPYNVASIVDTTHITIDPPALAAANGANQTVTLIPYHDMWIEAVCSTPHGLRSGEMVPLSGPPWPDYLHGLVMQDGSSPNENWGWGHPAPIDGITVDCYVTSSTTFLIHLSGSNNTWAPYTTLPFNAPARSYRIAEWTKG